MFSVVGKWDLLSDVEVSAGSGSVKGNPAFIVGLVDAGSMLHQEGHHVHIIIYAGLENRRNELTSKHHSMLVLLNFM